MQIGSVWLLVSKLRYLISTGLMPLMARKTRMVSVWSKYRSVVLRQASAAAEQAKLLFKATGLEGKVLALVAQANGRHTGKPFTLRDGLPEVRCSLGCGQAG